MSQCHLPVDKRLDLYSSQLSEKISNISHHAESIGGIAGGVIGAVTAIPIAVNVAAFSGLFFSDIIYNSDQWNKESNKNHSYVYKLLFSFVGGLWFQFYTTLEIGTGIGMGIGNFLGKGITPVAVVASISYDASYFILDQSIELMGLVNYDYCLE